MMQILLNAKLARHFFISKVISVYLRVNTWMALLSQTLALLIALSTTALINVLNALTGFK